MPGETDLHKLLKKEACKWLFSSGYHCIAAEVRLKPLGIIDAVGTGMFPAGLHQQASRRSVHQACFIECKASRSDFIRDLSNDGQMQLCLLERRTNLKSKRRARGILRQHVGLGKFAACLLQPMANLHYILAPAELIKKVEVPPRWGLLSYKPGGVSVIVKAAWQDCCYSSHVESAIARTLTGDIYRADDRAMGSVNREIMIAQQKIAARLREIKSISALVDSIDEASAEPDRALPAQTSPAD
jgi:hypothetical protein